MISKFYCFYSLLLTVLPLLENLAVLLCFKRIDLFCILIMLSKWPPPAAYLSERARYGGHF